MSPRPIKTAFLYTGYVETQSHSCLILTHRKGFKTKEQLVNHLHQVFKLAIEHRTELDSNLRRQYDTVSEVVFDYIRGDNQDDAYDIWQALDYNGWLEGPQKKFGRSIIIDKAEVVLENNNIYDSSQYFSHEKCSRG